MIDSQVLERHGLKPEEYDRIVKTLGREPNLTELGIFSVMWSEHCSYKSSRVHLKTLPTTGKRVLQEGRGGAVWIAAYNGVAVWRAGRVQLFRNAQPGIEATSLRVYSSRGLCCM